MSELLKAAKKLDDDLTEAERVRALMKVIEPMTIKGLSLLELALGRPPITIMRQAS